mmetsp:Transcript_22563/g.50169  ORF Transcript_22563/g.50169 Transcript_22563/m.50169 type:complete len:202 (-) Transcript_22563:189-794(-)
MRSRGGEDESLEAARLLLLLQTLLDHRKTHLADGAPPALAQLVLCVVADLLHIRLHQVGQHLLRHKPLHVQPARHQRRCVVLAHVPSHLCSAHHHLLALLAHRVCSSRLAHVEQLEQVGHPLEGEQAAVQQSAHEPREQPSVQGQYRVLPLLSYQVCLLLQASSGGHPSGLDAHPQEAIRHALQHHALHILLALKQPHCTH